MQGVRLESSFLVKAAKGSFAPVRRKLPGEIGVEFDIPASSTEVQRLLHALPVEYEASMRPLVGGTRLRITPRAGRLRSKLARKGRKSERSWKLQVALVTEEQRLRELAELVRLPIPMPRELGAQLELWKEAEQATFNRQMHKARRLWEKLSEQKKISHLCHLRIAELFLMTGHVNEAIARLRDVSASFPRSTGAALARLTALHLEILTEQGSPSAEQIILASQTGHYRRFRNFANLRAAFALVAMQKEELALSRFPEPELLPKIWRQSAMDLAATAVARSIYRPLRRRQAADAVAQYEAWKHWVVRHPQRAIVERDIAQAYLDMGMSDPAIALVRRQLESFPDPRSEALLVQQLVRAYHNLQSAHEHELESVLYLLKHHPTTPGVQSDLRALLMGRYQAQGWEFANASAKLILDKNSPVEWKITLLEALSELAMAEDRPQVVITRLEQRFAFPPEPSLRHRADYALSMAQLSPSKSAVSLLRNLITKVTASDLHDRLAFALAQTEGALGNHESKNKILDELVDNGTVWGLLARAERRSQALGTIVSNLQKRNEQ